MAYFIFTICAVIALFAYGAEARTGRGMLSEVSTGRTLLNFSSNDPEPAKSEIVKLSVEGKLKTKDLPKHQKVDEAVQSKATDSQSKSEYAAEAEEDEVVCTEMGACYEKRLLTATIDYETDRPNIPITDPPH